MADYTETAYFRFLQRESAYGRRVDSWQARCAVCDTSISVSQDESADVFIGKLCGYNISAKGLAQLSLTSQLSPGALGA